MGGLNIGLKNTNKQTVGTHHKKGFINLQFQQKLSSHKPLWDEARLSSLVNKRFAVCGISKIQYYARGFPSVLCPSPSVALTVEEILY